MEGIFTESLATIVRSHARLQPERPAFIEADRQISWREYDCLADVLARRLQDSYLQAGDRVAVYLSDGIELHIALLAVERAGMIALGIGARAGWREVEHLLALADARALISVAWHRGNDMTAAISGLRAKREFLFEHFVLEDDFVEYMREANAGAGEALLQPQDVFLLNSTSGTTGMPKCVVHDQARWYAFHKEAVTAAELTTGDVFLGAAPPPFGFGLWTTHVTPTLLGVPTVVLAEFEPRQVLALIARHRVTVLAAVSTQFIMLLNDAAFEETDFSSLRVLFTGGEMVPYARALAFEQHTDAAVLQFYGSNETGALSRTRLADPVEKRLQTAGKLIEAMDIRLFNDAGEDVTASGEGQPGVCGPLLSAGYYNDAGANARLFNGRYMLMEDIVTIDGDGYLTVAGRKGDFIIRGGKNISAAAVEQACASHPDVALAVALGVPDAVMGEKTLAFVCTHSGCTIELEELLAFLDEENVSREIFPEYVLNLESMPRSSGGKLAKAELKEMALEFLEQQASCAVAEV